MTATKCSPSRGPAPPPAATRRSSPSATSPSCATGPRATSSQRSAARRRSSTSRDVPRLVLEETGLLPHVNPGVMTREELAPCARSPRRRASCSRRPRSGSRQPRRAPLRLARQAPGGAARDDRGRAGELAVPFTTGILIGIGETREERIDALLAIRDAARTARTRPGGDRPELPREAGDEDGRRIPSRRSRSSSGRQPPPGSCSARRCTSRRRRTSRYEEFPAAPRRGDRRLGRHLAGHARPREPRGALARDRAAARGDARPRGLDARPAAAAVSRVRAAISDAGATPSVRGGDPARGRTRTGSPAKTPGRQERPCCPRGVDSGPGPGPCSGRAYRRIRAGGKRKRAESVAVRQQCARQGRRGDRAGRGRRHRSLRGARRRPTRRPSPPPTTCVVRSPATRSRYVVTRNVNYTNVCYFRCGFCAFSKGRLAANLRGAPYLVPLDEIVRRAREAWDRGAVEICLQGGIHPASPARRTSRSAPP